MKWKTNKIKLSPTDLEVLNGRKFESLLPQILSGDGAKPPLITPVVLPLMVYSDCASKKEFFFRYRTMLEIANHAEQSYRRIVLFPKKEWFSVHRLYLRNISVGFTEICLHLLSLLNTQLHIAKASAFAKQ